jgi:hypothetical protein
MKYASSSLILCAALAACGGTDEATRTGMDATAVVVELTGCVGVSPGAGEFALRQVQFASDEARRDAAAVPGITENAWVRLEGDQLASMLGEHVRLRGEVVDTGANTIGTAGAYGYETPSGDASQADSDAHYSEKQQLEAGRIARESLANGAAAMLRVLNVERTGTANCEAPRPAPTRDSH